MCIIEFYVRTNSKSCNLFDPENYRIPISLAH